MRFHLRRALCLLLAAVMLCSGAAAYSRPAVNTKFEYILREIENNSLYTQDKGMSEAEIDKWNAYLEKNPSQLEKVVNDYLATLDTHSQYYPPQKYEEGFAQLAGYVGIGITMQQSPEGVLVSGVNRSGPAFEAGIQVGDRIVALDGKDVTSMSSTQLAAMARGEAGTKLAVSVMRGDKRLDFILVRRQIKQEYVFADTVADGVEYVRVEAMGSNKDLTTFQEIWNGLDEKNTRAVILDLRGNGGGLIDVAWGMAHTIIEKKGTYMGSIQWRKDQGDRELFYAKGGGLPLNKLCVLVDGQTASAAEMLAGVLKEAAGAEVIGRQTYGKGQGQYHITLMDQASWLVITTLEMHLPQAGCWEGVGITPTLAVKDNTTTGRYLAELPALDTAKKISYGQKSEQVRALSGRLFVLGYAKGAADVFDTDLLSALRRFQQEQGLPRRMVADTATLAAVDEAARSLDTTKQMLDNTYYTALDLCKQAAAKPARYTTAPNGTWKAA